MATSGDSLFARQLATYSSYHRDARNRATHFIGIPAIVFSILVPLALVHVGGVSLALIVGALAVIGWIALDRLIGFAMLVVMLPMWLIAEWIARDYGSAQPGRYSRSSLSAAGCFNWSAMSGKAAGRRSPIICFRPLSGRCSSWRKC